jgi:hypothetical protein
VTRTVRPHPTPRVREQLIPRCRTRAAAVVLVTLLAHGGLGAQSRSERNDLPSVIAGNSVLGGLTAAAQALLAGKPVMRALLTGAIGGAVHGAGKILSTRSGFAAIAVGAAGTSIVANAGRGAAPFDELMMPLGPARLRYSAERGIHASVNAFESAMLGRRLLQPGARMDWSESLRTGAFVLRSTRPLYSLDDRRAAGLSAGSVILLSDRAWNSERTLDHERIHAHQGWFLQETWGRPLERALRQRSVALSWIPSWVDVGVFTPGLLHLERRTIGLHGPIRSWHEAEAESLERWSR